MGDWHFIEEHKTFQESLKLGNHLRMGHAAKAENESESCRPGNQADELEYCNVELHLPQFSEYAATVGFCAFSMTC